MTFEMLCIFMEPFGNTRPIAGPDHCSFFSKEKEINKKPEKSEHQSSFPVLSRVESWVKSIAKDYLGFFPAAILA